MWLCRKVDRTTSTNNPDVYVHLVENKNYRRLKFINTTLSSAQHAGKESKSWKPVWSLLSILCVCNASSWWWFCSVDIIIKNNANVSFAKRLNKCMTTNTSQQAESKQTARKLACHLHKIDQNNSLQRVVDTTSSTYKCFHVSFRYSNSKLQIAGTWNWTAVLLKQLFKGSKTIQLLTFIWGHVLYNQQADSSTMSGELGGTVKLLNNQAPRVRSNTTT